MQPVDSQVLHLVSKALRLASAGAQETFFDDATLNQTFDVTGVARRGLTLASTTGIHGASIINTHAVANTQSNTVDPWALAAAAVAPFPAAIPDYLDLWILWASAFTSAGAGAFTGADFTMLIPAANEAFGAGGSVGMRLATFTSELAIGGTIGSQLSQSTTGAGIPARLGTRIPRNGTLRFRSVSTGAATYRLDMFLGLFPIGMGQDGLV